MPGGAWQTLLECSQHSQLVRYGCASTAYASYVAHLRADEWFAPPLSLSHLHLPPGSRTLFFGTSFTREVVENLLCASGLPQGRASCATLSGSVPYPHLPSFNSWTAECKLARNTTLIAVINDPFLQSERCHDARERMLARVGDVDYTFFTRPHSECWHRFYQEWISRYRARRTAFGRGESPDQSVLAAHRPEGRAGKRPCWVDLDGARLRDLSRDQAAWEQLRRHSRRGIWEVSVWSARNASTPGPLTSGSDRAADGGRLASASFFDASGPVRSHPCRTSSSQPRKSPASDCEASADGHQCLVSGVTEVARQLVGRVTALQGAG